MYIKGLFQWIREIKERCMYDGLPYNCWHCALLGICRRPKEEGWKCYNGCMIINADNKRKYEGLPRGCWNCQYLKECRRPKEEGWKCYNGCRVIKERNKRNEEESNIEN